MTVCRRVVDYDWHTEQGEYRYVFLSELVISPQVRIMSHDSRPGLFYLLITRFIDSPRTHAYVVSWLRILRSFRGDIGVDSGWRRMSYRFFRYIEI